MKEHKEKQGTPSLTSVDAKIKPEHSTRKVAIVSILIAGLVLTVSGNVLYLLYQGVLPYMQSLPDDYLIRWGSTHVIIPFKGLGALIPFIIAAIIFHRLRHRAAKGTR